MAIIKQLTEERRLIWLTAAVLLGLFMAAAFALAQTTSGPSAFCHKSDGVFTDCDDNPENGIEEWSDITPTAFAASGAFLYVDQADLDSEKSIPNGSGIDTLMLMYDEVQRTEALLPGEVVHVHFMTVDELRLVHYDVAIGADGLEEVRINGVVQDPMPSGLKGMAGHGFSPNSSNAHVMAEFQIGLEAAGFTSEECCYSPDPAWWGSDVPPDPVIICPEGETNETDQGRGDCKVEPQESETTTAGVFTANPDGSTTVEPQPLLPVDEEPSLCESIGRIVDFRVSPTGTYKNHGDYVKQAAQLTEALVNSQVDAGLITADEAETLQSCVVNPRARSEVGK